MRQESSKWPKSADDIKKEEAQKIAKELKNSGRVQFQGQTVEKIAADVYHSEINKEGH